MEIIIIYIDTTNGFDDVDSKIVDAIRSEIIKDMFESITDHLLQKGIITRDEYVKLKGQL